MLTKVEPGPAIVACNTCRSSGGPAGSSGGAKLVAALREGKAADTRYAGIAVQEMPCLFACNDFCAVHLRAPGKVSYVLGRFTPDAEAARAILDYAVHYADSEHGNVPFGDWPEGVKGHFITRSPPEGFVAE